MHQSDRRFLIPWLVGASDIRRYLGRACNQCQRGRIIFFFPTFRSVAKRSPLHLLCLAPVNKPDVIAAAYLDFKRGRYHCMDLATLRCKEIGNLAMTVLKWRGDQIKPAIEEASGRWITTNAAGKRLKCSAERIRKQITRGAMVGYPALGNQRRWRIPLWQFAKGNKIHAWVPELIRAHGSNGWALIHFVSVPRISLDGGNLLHLLQSGRVGDVLAAARRSNPD